MRRTNLSGTGLLAVAAVASLFLGAPSNAAAHCDTLDGPVVEDARKAIQAQDATPVLKWVQPKHEKAVRAAFQKVLADRSKDREAAERTFFSTLVKVHREGEGEPFLGLKPAGSVAPAIAAADKALAGGSDAALVEMITSEVAAGIRARYEKAAEGYRHKDENVAKGREFVEAYVAYTHYVERLAQDAAGADGHGGGAGHGHPAEKSGHKKEHTPHHNH